MSETYQGFEALGGGAAPSYQEEAPLREQKLDKLGRAYATGKRKNAIARVWLKPGKGDISINGKTCDEYFARPVLRMMVRQPFVITDRGGHPNGGAFEAQYDVYCTVVGSGLSGQAGAVRHAISKALADFEPPLRPTLKHAGFMTRDSRVVERKKYGKAKARRSFQFSKR